MSTVYQDLVIEVAYSDDFERQVVDKDDPDPLTTITIQAVNSTSKEISRSRDWAGHILTELLASLDDITDDEKKIIRYHNGPSYLVFEPNDDNTVNVTMCILLESVENPEERLPVEETITIPKDALISESVRAAKEFHRKVLELNPELKNSTEMSDLMSQIQEVEPDYSV